jgi:tape measure domain-containing protein
MAELATLQIKVDASGAIRAVDQFGNSAQGASTKATGLQGAVRSLAGAFGLVQMGRLAMDGIRAADTMRLLDGRIRMVTGSERERLVVEDALRRSAAATRSSYEAVVGLYTRVARNAEDLGFAQNDLLRFTELTQMAVKSAGASASESAAGYQQLAQAIASGELRGDEFRSVMENMPGLARAMADGLGVPIGELRRMAHEGELTADKVIAAVLKMDKQIRGDFATAPVTVADAWTRFTDEVKISVSQFNENTGFTSKVAAGLLHITDLVTNLGSTWTVTWVEMQVAAQKSINAVRAALATADIGVGAGIHALTRGAMGTGIMGWGAGRLGNISAENAALDELLEQARLGLNRRTNGGAPRSSPGNGAPPELGFRMTAEAAQLAAQLEARYGAIAKGLVGTKDELEAVAKLLDQSFSDGAKALEGQVETARELKARASEAGKAQTEWAKNSDERDRRLEEKMFGDQKYLEELSRTFREQTQIAAGEFFADFFRSGSNDIGAFWRQFTDLGIDAVGNLLGKHLMEKADDFFRGSLGKNLGALGFGVAAGTASGNWASGALSGAVGGATIGGPLGALIGGLSGAVAGLFGASKAQKEAAERQREAAKRQEEAARAFSVSQRTGRADWEFDFLGFKGGDDLQRELLGISRSRNTLGTKAWDLLQGTGATFSNQLKGLVGAGRWDDAIDVARRDLNSFPQSTQGREALELFISQLERLKTAFNENTEAAKEAAAANKAAQWTDRQNSLKAFLEDLGMSDLSGQSSVQRYASARDQFNAMLGLAQGGDASAIESLPETARAFLEFSRENFASGARFQADYANVREALDALIGSIDGWKRNGYPVGGGIIDVTDTIPEVFSRLQATLADSSADQDARVAETNDLLTRLTQIGEAHALATLEQTRTLAAQLAETNARLDQVRRAVDERAS